jgi:hypothetical protein
VHNHGAGNFEYSFHLTAHIENLWANLKKYITSIYMPKKNFSLFLREAELRYNLISQTKEDKINIIKDIFKLVYINYEFTFGLIE